jgi:hypothetical protein
MLFKSLHANGARYALARATALGGASAVLALVVASAAVGAQGVHKCALSSPSFSVSGSAGVFEITVDCSPSAANTKAFPAGDDVLVGLTLYPDAKANELLGKGAGFEMKRKIDAASPIASALKTMTSSRSVTVAGGPKWIVLKDEDIDSFDLPVQAVRIDAGTSKVLVRFQAELAAFQNKRHMLFAAWAKSARNPCERTDRARSGCKNEGYVMGDGSGVSPIASYPGMEINELKHPAGDWTTERWIVERFR